MMPSSLTARASLSAALLLAMSGCGGGESDTLSGGPGAAPPGVAEAEAPGGVLNGPAWGIVTQGDADRVGVDASELCTAPQSLALLRGLQRGEGPPPKSYGGYTTDYGGFVDWNLRMAGMASFPDAEDEAVPDPPGLLTICWYTGSFNFAEDTDSGTATGTNIVVVFDEKGGRRIPVVSHDAIGIIAPSPPQLPVLGREQGARRVSLPQMPGTEVVPGLSLSERRASAGPPDPVPGEN